VIWTTLIMALREIRRNTMRSILTTLGIVIGVASVIAMITLGRGATARITADIAAMGNNLLILVPGADRRGPAAQTAQAFKVEDAKAIEREATAAADVAPSATRTQMVVYGDKNWSTAITGATNAYFDVRGYVFARGGGFSEVETTTGAAVCVLGETVRRELFGLQEAIGATIRAGNIACRVIGTLETKGQSSFGLDQDDFVTIPLATFQRRIAGNNDVGAIFVNAVSDKDTTRATEQIQSLMRERRHIRPGAADDFMVQDMKEITKTLGSVTQALTGLLGAIAGVSLLVGGIGIMNIMLVSVTERTREIGIRLAIGARGREVLLQFLVEAVTLSSLGGFVGAVIGLGGSYGAARAFHLPFAVMPDILVLAFGFSTAVGIAFGFFPAQRAARLNPIEALRHE
jgi:putative ABC transport system permease protein